MIKEIMLMMPANMMLKKSKKNCANGRFHQGKRLTKNVETGIAPNASIPWLKNLIFQFFASFFALFLVFSRVILLILFSVLLFSSLRKSKLQTCEFSVCGY